MRLSLRGGDAPTRAARFRRPPRGRRDNETGSGDNERRGRNRLRWSRIISAAVLVCVLAVCAGLLLRAGNARHERRPPPNGYFRLLPVGSYASLPDDAAAAARVQRPGWEIRPGNARYNHRVPHGLALQPVDVAGHAYDPRWNKYILGRISGNFTGTTDEIFQWAAAKWGVPDNLIRAMAVVESHWHQSEYGDYIDDSTKCPPGYRSPCPVTFGIVGTRSTSWPGIYPWNRESTPAAVDVLGGWLRGCYEGWVWWLRDHGNRSLGAYHAGDIWGCVGAWYSGNWHDGAAGQPYTGENYIHLVQHWYEVKPWLRAGF